MRAIILSGQYKKDLKRARKRNLPEAELDQVNDVPSSPERKDHSVFGRSSGNVYIYTSEGVQAIIPMKYFVTPKDKR